MLCLGINGFGRIGRVIFRACLQKSDFEITAINDPAIDVQYICYLIKYDSTHGRFNGSISHNKEEIIVNDKRIKIFHEKLPTNIPWHTAGVNYVIEASGMFTTMEKASGHLANDSVRRVIVTAPSVDVFMLILGVNDDKLHDDQRVMSCASSTLYCLAPIVKVLGDSFGVADGFVTSIHAMTPSLKPLDGLCLRGKHWRDHRSIHQNIIPAMTGACKALGKIMPWAKDKLCGLAFRVPIVNVSVLDISIRLTSNTSLQHIIQKVEDASNAHLKGIIRISKDNAVSSDFIGETHSCVLDVDSSLQLKPNFFKLVCWYENEYSYACRVVDAITFVENKFCSTNTILNTVNTKDNTQQTESFKSKSQNADLKHRDRQLVLKKPISSQLSYNTQHLVDKDDKSENELFKIWNDEKNILKTDIRNNRNSFFHSCIAITPRNVEQIDSVIAQDRLEMFKKEFSRMVNVTESLLKKSYVGTIHSKSDNKALKDNSESNIHMENRCDVLAEKSKIIKKNNIFENRKSSNIDELKNNNSSNKDEKLVQVDKKRMQCENSIQNVSFENEIKGIEKRDTRKNPVDPFKRNLETDVPNNVISPPLTINKDEEEVIMEKREHEHSKPKVIDEEARTIVKINSSVQISKKLINELNKTCKLYSTLKKSDSKVRLTVKRDINEIKFEKRVADRNVDSSVDINSRNLQSLARDEAYSNKSSSKVNRISPERFSIISDRTSKCGSPDNTSLTISNVDTYCRKEDIFDKLDSVSGTDSNNSFQIHERKSQVINLDDLTTSLEDIGRLDKICKIIEISDELSNKLFSALDNDEIEIRKKKWSFKDLCEKIKLDDFCDSVFGKSSG